MGSPETSGNSKPDGSGCGCLPVKIRLEYRIMIAPIRIPCVQSQPMFRDLIQNISLVSAVTGWLLAQLIKLLNFIIRERKFDYGFLFRLGGMPSSHTASAAACATSVGLRSGFGSPVFALAAGLLALIMIDAQSVRRAAGVQARLLNQIAEDFYRNHKFSPDKLVEFLGHTRLEVLMGLLLGIVVALLVHGFFPEWAGPMPALNT